MKTIKLIGIVVLLIAIGVAIGQAVPKVDYEALLKRDQRSIAKKYVELARWCAKSGLGSEAKEYYQKALKLDSDNKKARAKSETEFESSAEIPEPIQTQYQRKIAVLNKYVTKKIITLAKWCLKNKEVNGLLSQVAVLDQYEVDEKQKDKLMAMVRQTYKGIPLRVMSFNLLVPGVGWDKHGWEKRKIVMVNFLKKYPPDLMGTQETVEAHKRYLSEQLPAYYQWLDKSNTEGCNVKELSDSCAIMYNSDRLEVKERGFFHLNDKDDPFNPTPFPGCILTRMVIWAIFTDRYTGQDIYFYNTHLCPGGCPGTTKHHEQSAELIARKLKGHDRRLPRLFTGDFNEQQSGAVGRMLLEKDRGGFTKGIFHSIDWIVYNDRVKKISGQAIDYKEAGIEPSDHQPLYSILVFPAKGPVRGR